MSRQDKILAQYEESLFTLLMSEAAEWEGRRLLEEAERLNRDPAAEVPEAVSERCRRTLRREFSRKGAAKFRRSLGRGLKAALAAACAASLLFTAAFAVSEEVRTYAVKLFIEIKDYCTSFSFTSGSEEELPLESPFFALGWLPEGFALYSQERRGSTMPSQSNTYKGPREKELFVDVDSISEYGVVSFDTENAASDRKVSTNGYDFRRRDDAHAVSAAFNAAGSAVTGQLREHIGNIPLQGRRILRGICRSGINLAERNRLVPTGVNSL